MNGRNPECVKNEGLLANLIAYRGGRKRIEGFPWILEPPDACVTGSFQAPDFRLGRNGRRADLPVECDEQRIVKPDHESDLVPDREFMQRFDEMQQVHVHREGAGEAGSYGQFPELRETYDQERMFTHEQRARQPHLS
jgi:hypothetical protein